MYSHFVHHKTQNKMLEIILSFENSLFKKSFYIFVQIRTRKLDVNEKTQAELTRV